jgi:hypothetical protein
MRHTLNSLQNEWNAVIFRLGLWNAHDNKNPVHPVYPVEKIQPTGRELEFAGRFPFFNPVL